MNRRLGVKVNIGSTLKESVYYSEILGRNQTYYIMTPKEIPTDVDLLFVQDGVDYLELGELKKHFGDLLQSEEVSYRKLYLVLIPPGTSRERYDYFHLYGENHNRYVQFFNKELYPRIVRSLSEKGKRIHKVGLLGDSLGGAVNLAISLDEPNRYTHLLFQSAAFHEEMVEGLENLDTPEWQILQMVGTEEDRFVSPMSGERLCILTLNRAMNKVFIQQGVNVTYVEQDEAHFWKVWNRNLPFVLSFFSNSKHLKGE